MNDKEMIEAIEITSSRKVRSARRGSSPIPEIVRKHDADLERQIEELRGRIRGLESKNRELRQARTRIEESRSKLLSLYESAPAGQIESIPFLVEIP